MEDDYKVLSELKFDGRQGNCEMQVCLPDLKQELLVMCAEGRLGCVDVWCVPPGV